MDISMDALLPKYTILCMFSHMSKRNFNDLFDKLTDTPEFSQFMNHIENNTAINNCTEFVKNTIYNTYDDQAKIILEDEELKSIFTDNSLTKEERVKLFIAKSAIKLISGGQEVPLEMYENPVIKQMIQTFDTMLMEIEGISDVNSAIELYHLVVSHYATSISNSVHSSIDVLKLSEGEDENTKTYVYDSCLDMIKNFNTTLDYESTYAINKRPRSNIKDKKDTKTNNTRYPKRPKK